MHLNMGQYSITRSKYTMANTHNKKYTHPNSKKTTKASVKHVLTANDFPELNISTSQPTQPTQPTQSRKQTKLEKKMNYVGVAKHFVTVEREEKVQDGWVKIKRDSNGFISRQFGRNVPNATLTILECNDKQRQYKEMQTRHANYREIDNERLFADYKYSWETESTHSSELNSVNDDELSNTSELSDDEFDDY